MFRFLAWLVTNHSYKVVAFWLVLFLAAIPFASRINEVLFTEVDAPPNSASAQVSEIIQTNFANREGYQVVLVSEWLERPSNVTEDVFVEAYRLEKLKWQELPSIGRIIDLDTDTRLPLNIENSFAVSLIELETKSYTEALSLTEELNELLSEHEDWNHLLTGGAALDNEMRVIAGQDARRAEIIGIPLSFLVLFWVFGSAVAVSLPLIISMVAIVLTLALLFFIGQVWPFATYAQIIVSMLGLATGIDYALVVVNRFREELGIQKDTKAATSRTLHTAGHAVFSSGFTGVISLFALLFPPSDFIRSIGAGGMLILGMSVLISITLLPAILHLLGHKINALSIKNPDPERSYGFWRAWSNTILARPRLFLVIGLLLILGISLPALNMQLAFGAFEGLTEKTKVRQAQNILMDAELDSLVLSYDVLVDFGDRGVFHPSSILALSKFSRALEEVADVEQVLSPTTVRGVPSLLVQQYYSSAEAIQDSPLAELSSLTVSRNARYALLQVFPKRLVNTEERVTLLASINSLGNDFDLGLIIGGDYVFEQEWIDSIYQSIPIALMFVYGITFILLSLTFKSIVLALKAIVLNSLTVTAAFGVITLVFQYGFFGDIFATSGGLGYIESSVPIFIFAAAFGISMDYEVFLLARVVEAHKNGMTDEDAIRYALTTTGNVISSAAFIMVIVFSAFFFSNILLIKSLSLGLAVAVFTDATIVRLSLVPSFMTLIGRLNWWYPKQLERLSDKANLSHD